MALEMWRCVYLYKVSLKYSGRYRSYSTNTIFTRKISKGHDSIKKCRWSVRSCSLHIVWWWFIFVPISWMVSVMEGTQIVYGRTDGWRAPHNMTYLWWVYKNIQFIKLNFRLKRASSLKNTSPPHPTPHPHPNQSSIKITWARLFETNNMVS